MADLPAILYPVRDGDSNDELRFSLRSLAMNFPHDRIWMVGYQPAWVKGVEYIEGGNSAPWPRANLYQNLLLACRHPDLPEDLTVWNDDFFLTNGPHPDPMPMLFRGPLAAQVNSVTRKSGVRGWWQESLLATMTALQAIGISDPISYELHVPFPIRKSLMLEALERFASVTPHNPPQWRTLYGNLHQLPGRKHPDCKMLRPGPLQRPYHSTDDLSWRHFRARFQQLFPDPSPYEIPSTGARTPITVSARRTHRTVRRVHV